MYALVFTIMASEGKKALLIIDVQHDFLDGGSLVCSLDGDDDDV